MIEIGADATAAARWRAAWSDHRFRVRLVGMTTALVAALSGFARFLGVNEARSGAALDDPLLVHLAPVDLTWVTFGLIYVSTFCALWYLARHPRALLVGITAYAVMSIIRMTMMYVTPLAPPDGLIPLVDPVIEFFGTGATVNRDLFFSGHTSTLFLLFLTANIRTLRVFFLACTVAVAACVLIQHVHYTVDVLVAPFAAFGAHRIARSIVG